ncbi:hypothetical protein [Halostagnicola kamekurae]|uniref:Uncharacterized protein n=1 Tax=Halostagnicola kamekurae TaxID=619731 RepID=A0A1I6V5T5_9EURY|nr:hypothetical protein [Halostagnicola kamekurae]SFT09063.1 hypothetical protein SAMN04488556_0075 [Halostagnicola kamekurae]
MSDPTSINEIVQRVLDKYADDIPQYREYAAKFQNLDRWTGSDPKVLIADAAGSATGLNYKNIVKPNVKAFREQFIESGKVQSLADLAALEHDPEFTESFTIGHPNIVYDIPSALLEDAEPNANGLGLLQTWAESADPEQYRSDPVGAVHGIGPATFQYLRMISGADTVKPDIQVEKFITELEKEHPKFSLDSSSDAGLIDSCSWLAAHSTYSMIEIDQIAWWTFSETESLSGTH